MDTVPPPPPPPPYTPTPRRRSPWPWVLALVVAVVLVGCTSLVLIVGNAADDAADALDTQIEPGTVAAASAAQPQQEPANPPIEVQQVGASVGVGVGDNQVDYRVVEVVEAKSDEFGIPASKGVLLGAHINVKVNKGQAYPLPTDWALVTADGTVVQGAFSSLKDRPYFQGGQLALGQQADGWVTWDVTEKALKGAKIQLTVTNLLTDDKQIFWALP